MAAPESARPAVWDAQRRAAALFADARALGMPRNTFAEVAAARDAEVARIIFLWTNGTPRTKLTGMEMEPLTAFAGHRRALERLVDALEAYTRELDLIARDLPYEGYQDEIGYKLSGIRDSVREFREETR